MIRRYKSHSLLPYNTFGIDVNAANFIEFESENELVQLIKEGFDSPVLVVGGGSNLLFMNNYKGTVLHSCIKGVEVIVESSENVFIRVGSGMKWDDLVAYTIEKGWQGLENLAAIPGEVGASAVQNVGAYGVEAGELIERVDTISLIDGTKRCFSQSECRFSYRNSIFKEEEFGKNVVTYVTYRLRKKPEFRLTYGNLRQRVDELGGVTPQNISSIVRDIRSSKLPDPVELGNAGSFFVNPVVSKELAQALAENYPSMPHYNTPDGRMKLSAAWLIEQCGWRGERVGNVGVYEKQALVIVNYGGATGKEIMAFADTVCESVKNKFGVLLNREVNIIM